MTRVIVTVEEEQNGKTMTILSIPIKEYLQTVKGSETAEAVSYAQRCISWIRRQQIKESK